MHEPRGLCGLLSGWGQAIAKDVAVQLPLPAIPLPDDDLHPLAGYLVPLAPERKPRDLDGGVAVILHLNNLQPGRFDTQVHDGLPQDLDRLRAREYVAVAWQDLAAFGIEGCQVSRIGSGKRLYSSLLLPQVWRKAREAGCPSRHLPGYLWPT